MNFKAIFHVLGALLIFGGLSLLLPMAFSIYYQDGDLNAFILSLVITTITGILLWRLTPGNLELQIRDGFAVVTFGWIALSTFGALPLVLCGAGISYTDAFFEIISGYTTTGATILTDVEALPHGILFWRSFTHWLGGMGIIVLSLAILPMLGVGGMQLFKAEVPGPSVDKLQPRIQDTAKILWGVYVVLSLIEAVLLKLGGMSFFDSLCHTFGTMATGGFSTKNVGIAHFDSAYIEYVITIFMIIAGTNFALHYRAMRGHARGYFANGEFKFYILIIAVFTFVLAVDLLARGFYTSEPSVRKSVFQVVSILTTTGFHSADYETWSVFAQVGLILLMFVGGCAGSTGGGVKVIRVFMAMKFIATQFKKLVHPHAVVPVRFGDKSVSRDATIGILGFLLAYFIIILISSWFMSLLGLDLVTSVSTVIATLGNIGPGVGTIGPTENYAHIPGVGKWVLSFLMLAGRLEIYTVLVIFNRTFWKK
jgi:trk system potassium uptake protein TrkH